jgi:hypothetical protein
VEHPLGSVPTSGTSVVRGPARTLAIVVGRIPGATPGPETRKSHSNPIGFYVRAFLRASVFSRGADSMWLTTSTVGPLISLSVPRSFVLYYDEYGSTVAYYRDRSLKDRPRLFPRVFTHSHNIPSRFRSISPLTKRRDARRFGVDLSLN